MNCNLKFRLGLLDGIQDRQTGSPKDVEKLANVKGLDYMAGYVRGYKTKPGNNDRKMRGNEK